MKRLKIESDFKEILAMDRKFIMGIAMICIMLFHEPFMTDSIFASFRQWGHLGVDVFLFISGYGIAHSLNKHKVRIYYFNRIARLLPSCLIWGTVALLFTLFVDRTPIPLRYYAMTPLCLDKWFIYAIVLFYAASPFLYRLAQRNLVFFLSLAISLSLINLRTDLNEWWPLNWALERFPIYCIGMAMFFLPELKNDWRVLLASSVSLFFLVSVIISGDQRFLYLLFIPTVPILFVIFHSLKKIFIKLLLAKFIEWMGAVSLELYLIHELVFKEIMKLDWNPCLLLVSAFAISFVLAYTTALITPFLQQRLLKVLQSSIKTIE